MHRPFPDLKRACTSRFVPLLSASCAALIVSLTSASGPARAAALTVSAAVSLTNAFKELGTAYETAHPGDKVALNFAASDVLVTQIINGAPVDVFASADAVAMERGIRQGALDATTRRDFARNSVVVIVPAGAQARPAALSDLGGAAYPRLSTGNPASVPIGRYTRLALEQAGLWTTLEAKFVFGQNVRQVLDYVARGEVDAGFVYSTDAAVLKDRVKAVLQAPLDQPPVYPIARTRDSTHPQQAQGFIDFVFSPAGQEILARHGFSRP